MAASKYNVIKKAVEGLLNDEVAELLTDITDGGGTHTPSAVLGQHLSKAFQAFYAARKKLGDDSLECAILALTKSGKSTLLNALCGACLLPSNNVPETARIVSIEHKNLKDGEKPYLCYKEGDQLIKVEGDNIYVQLEYLNKEVRGRKHCKGDENILSVKTEIAALKHEGPVGDVKLKLLDTPGPNESGEDALKHSVERLLDSVDAVVYILDYTKLKTSEETQLLRKLKESNPQLVDRLAQRLFFVVNKVDVMQTCDGLDEDELRPYVADLVTTQMNTPSFTLQPEQIFLVSAQDALLSRLILLGTATSKDREKFARKAFGRDWVRRTDAELKAAAAEILEESHLPELENCLLSYLYTNAGGLKLVSVLDAIVRMLMQIQNVAVTGRAALKQSAEDLEKEIMDLESHILETTSKFGSIKTEANEVEAQVIDNVQERMQNLKDRLFSHISQVLDTTNEPKSLPEAHRGPWKRIWEKSVAFLTRGGAGQSDSDALLKAKLGDLHQDIKSQIEREIGDFWHDLEIATNKRHNELINVINVNLTDLARQIEGVVGSALDLTLEPIDICMKPPSAEEFHNSIQELFTTGIRTDTRTETRWVEEETVVWEQRRRGLCGQTEYYVGVPVKTNVPREELLTTYHLHPDKIKEYFMNLINTSVETSIKHVRGYVHVFMSDRIELARGKIHSYSEQYSETMQAALRAKSASADEQEAGLAALEAHLQQIHGIIKHANSIMHNATALFPHVDSTTFDWVTEPELDLSMEEQIQERDPLLQTSGSATQSGVETAHIAHEVLHGLHVTEPQISTKPTRTEATPLLAEPTIDDESEAPLLADSSMDTFWDQQKPVFVRLDESDTEESSESEESDAVEKSESDEEVVGGSSSDDEFEAERPGPEVQPDPFTAQEVTGKEILSKALAEMDLSAPATLSSGRHTNTPADANASPADPTQPSIMLLADSEGNESPPMAKMQRLEIDNSGLREEVLPEFEGPRMSNIEDKSVEDKVKSGTVAPASWQQHMGSFMSGLGITDPDPRLPLSSAHAENSSESGMDVPDNAAKTNQLSSKNSGDDGAHFCAKAASTDSVSSDWECVSEDEVAGHP